MPTTRAASDTGSPRRGCAEDTRLTRRRLLAGGGASIALWSLLPRAAIAGTRDPRLLTMILRGGLDGISLAAPIGDPDYARIRGNLAIPATGQGAGFALNDFFALNPNMPFLAGLYGRREAIVVHAVHSPYRARSHFDGQDVLESGLAGVGRADDGWLNRALAGLPAVARVAPHKGLAMGAVVPLVMRGEAPVLSWIPKTYNLPLRDATVARLMDLYSVTDPALARAFREGLEIDRVAAMPVPAASTPTVPPVAPAAPRPGTAAPGRTATPATPATPKDGGAPAAPTPPGPRPFGEFVVAAEAAARFLAAADGPRIGALSYNGWDTHANEGVVTGQLANRLAGLDAAIRTFHDGMGGAWKDTVVVIVTEFGRTARVNGTEGTDHGMATTALVLGGAVKGGRVIADWPGLADKALFENRDLAPTRDLRTVLKGVLRDHLAIPPGVLADKVFPGSAGVVPLDGLLA